VSAEFRPYQEIDVMARVAGYVREIRVEVGDRVSEGQLLADLEVPEMQDEINRLNATVERSQAEVERAREEVRRAETARRITHLNYERLRKVAASGPGLVAQHEIDTAQNRDLMSESLIASARTALDASEQALKVQQAEMAKSQKLYCYARVLAPFSGVISKRYVDTGSMVQAGTASQARPIARLSQTSTLRLVVPIPEAAVARLKAGAPVEVHVGPRSWRTIWRGRSRSRS
jgi:multidrug resistance efflux pump